MVAIFLCWNFGLTTYILAYYLTKGSRGLWPLRFKEFNFLMSKVVTIESNILFPLKNYREITQFQPIVNIYVHILYKHRLFFEFPK